MKDGARRIAAALAGGALGAAFIGLMTMALPAAQDGFSAGGVLLDRASSIYPFTIQNAMWLLFFAGLGDLCVRLARGALEMRQMRLGTLPEDDETMLRAQDLGRIYSCVRAALHAEAPFLQRLIARIALQFQASESVGQSHSLLNSSLELFQHEIDLKYSMLHYLAWALPTLGFIGTVVGIALALGEAGNMPDIDDAGALGAWMKALTGSLALAFNTTLLALLLSAVLVLLTHIAQGREESALNQAGQHCLDNLINRLYEK